MKKSILYSACAFVAFSLVFTSCSDDDDNSSGVPNSNVGVIVTDDGAHLLLSSITEGGHAYYSFGYDSNGKLTYFSNWEDCTVSYDPFEMTWVDEASNYYGSGYYQFTFNSSGYASKILYAGEWDENNYSNRNENGTIDLSYDSNGHLTKMSGYISSLSRGYGSHSGETESKTETFTITLTWNKGNLISANVTNDEEEIGNGRYVHSTENAEYSFTYSNTPNKYNQYVIATTFEFFDYDRFFGFGFLGYLGKGTAYLPTKYEVSGECNVEQDDSEYGYHEYGYDLSGPNFYSYTINDDGTINTEKEGYHSSESYDNTFTYHYTTLGGTRSVAEETVAKTLSKQDMSRHKGLRARHREHHNKQMFE